MKSLALPPTDGDGVADADRRAAAPQVDVVVPVHNEERVLQASLRTLHRFLSDNGAFSFRITVADNASTDRTLEIASALSRELTEVRVLHLAHKGRGRALRSAWGMSDADVVAYMDVDLSTDLEALPELVGPLLEGRGDLAIGSRLAPGARVTRGLKRELISRIYNILLRVLLRVSFSDAQCGFKAGRREAIHAILDQVEDQRWFFDTELLYIAQRAKLAIHEVPVRWVDDPDSRVDILTTVGEDLRGIVRLRRAGRTTRQRGEGPREASARAAGARHGRIHGHSSRLTRTST